MSPQGHDAGKGTLAAPLRSISRAVTLAQPGDVIRVLPGLYAENLLLDSKGAGAAAITLRGEGTTPPLIAPGDRTRSTVIFVRGRWNLENLHINVGGAPMFAVAFVSGSSQSSLSGSELHGGTNGAGVLVEGATRLTIQDNHIHHFIKPGDDSHGVVVVGPSRDVTLRGNDIHHNSGDSVQCQAGNIPAAVLLIEGNTLHDEGENAVDIKQCHDVIVRDNQAYGFPNTAIRPPGSSAGEAVVIHEAARGIVVQGNTFSKAGRGVSVLGGSAIPEDIWIEGNTLREIRNFPAGNGQAIRIAGGKNVQVVGNTIESAASYGLMLAADGQVVTGLIVRNNRVRKASQPLLLRLGRDVARPGMLMSDNQYALGGVLKADGVQGKLVGASTVFMGEFPGEQLTLSTPQKLGVWRQVLGVDQNSELLP